MDLEYKLRLRFPNGPVVLSEVTGALVQIPLAVIKSVSVEKKEEWEVILRKSEGTIEAFCKELRKSLAPWSPLRKWDVFPLSIRPLRDEETSAIIGVGFIMLRLYDSGKPGGLGVEILCDASPSGGELGCEVMPWGSI
jgi:hypothetical protein